MIVDDSPDLLNILHWSLKRCGYSCETAYYREGLIRNISTTVPALILMDVNLDADDGRQLCLELKQNPATKTIPVILCSARHELLQNFKSFLADDYIEKPFEMKLLVSKIEKLLKLSTHKLTS